MPDNMAAIFFHDPAFWLAGVLAVSLFGLSKGGFAGLAVLSMPIFALAIPTLQAAAIMLPVLIVQDAIGLWSFRRAFDREGLIVLLAGAILGTFVATALAGFTSEALVKLALGAVALGFGLSWWAERLRGLPEKEPRRPSRFSGLFWGGACGFTSFIAHAGAPPAQVYLMPLRLAPAVFAGTFTWLFALLNLIKLGPYISLGLITRETMIASVMLFPVAALSMLAGIWLVRRIPAARFYPIIYALLMLVGGKLLWDGVRGFTG